MLNSFDWLRRGRTGAELLAILKHLNKRPDLFSQEQIGPPHSALRGPCQRCWLYPPDPEHNEPYCQTCRTILATARRFSKLSRQSIVVWGFVNQLPKQLQSGQGFEHTHRYGAYIHDERRFLLTLYRRKLKPWLQELVIYHGDELRGMLQIFPTMGAGEYTGMGDVICRAVHHEADFSRDRLRVKFYADAFEVLKPRRRDEQGILIFEISDFLSLLEMAAVFRTVLRPEEQKVLHELLNIEDAGEERFYWGRLLGYLSKEAKDMLNAWKIRQWPPARIKLLYELIDYVAFYQTD
jgi:hypothetical protein